MSPAAPGGRFGDVTSAHIVRGQFARIERRRIPSGWARMARAGMDSVALGSHYASRARLRAGRVRAAVRDPSRGGPAALLDPDSPASSPPELGSTHSELAGALVLTVHAQTSRHAVMAQYEHANRALWTGGAEPCLWSPARRAGRVRAAVRDPSRGVPAALLDPDSPASSPPELGSTHSELAGALVLTVHAQTSRHAVMAQYEHANRALWTGGAEPCLWSPARRANPGNEPRTRGPATGDPRLRALPASRHRTRIGKLIHHPLNNLHTTDFSGSMASSVSPMESSRTSRSYAS